MGVNLVAFPALLARGLVVLAADPPKALAVVEICCHGGPLFIARPDTLLSQKNTAVLQHRCGAVVDVVSMAGVINLCGIANPVEMSPIGIVPIAHRQFI